MKKLFIILFSFISVLSFAQNKSIKGNGQKGSQKRMLKTFNAIYIDMFCDVYVQNGSMPMAEITADKNVLDKIELSIDGNELTIKTKDGFWLVNSRPKIYLQSPFIHKVTTKGIKTNIGEIVIEGIDVKEFKTDILFGSIKLMGKAEKLDLKSSNRSYYAHQGIVDASMLMVKEVSAKMMGSNTATVWASEKLTADLIHDATLSYAGMPKEVKISGVARRISENQLAAGNKPKKENLAKKQSPKKLDYISLEVKNNSPLRRQFIIKGPNPSGKKFSYGFPLMPYAKRSKNVPVGTAIYTNGMKKLVTITAENEGEVIELFN